MATKISGKPHGRGASPWTPKKIEKLRKSWERICTLPGYFDALQLCAEEIGMSRNQVAGKLRRLRLPTRNGYERTETDKRKRPRATGPQSVRRTTHVLQLTDEIEEQPTGRSVTIIGLERIDKTQELINDGVKCHWPVEGGLFCGANATRIVTKTDEEGNVLHTKPSPYCAYHTRLAYQPNSQPRSKRNGTSKGIEEQVTRSSRYGRVPYFN